jgi:hypothetical protein
MRPKPKCPLCGSDQLSPTASYTEGSVQVAIRHGNGHFRGGAHVLSQVRCRVCAGCGFVALQLGPDSLLELRERFAHLQDMDS